MPKINLQKEEDFSNNSEFIDDLDLSEEIQDEQNKNNDKSSDSVNLSFSKIKLIKDLLLNSEENIKKVKDLLSGYLSPEDEEKISIGQLSDTSFENINTENSGGGRIIEGVFDGEQMIGPDGKHYSIPANYASKSKLIEGDILKLTITPSGTFVYKQIGPIERTRVIASLEQDEASNFHAIADGKKWKVLTASVTYYKGSAGDEVVILVPKTGESGWAAVENIVKKSF
jgi:hypothetical protein